jgi:hypothetical protein
MELTASIKILSLNYHRFNLSILSTYTIYTFYMVYLTLLIFSLGL